MSMRFSGPFQEGSVARRRRHRRRSRAYVIGVHEKRMNRKRDEETNNKKRRRKRNARDARRHRMRAFDHVDGRIPARRVTIYACLLSSARSIRKFLESPRTVNRTVRSWTEWPFTTRDHPANPEKGLMKTRNSEALWEVGSAPHFSLIVEPLRFRKNKLYTCRSYNSRLLKQD